jgi:hypothetical protein
VPGFVYDTHPAVAQDFKNLMIRDVRELTDRRCRRDGGVGGSRVWKQYSQLGLNLADALPLRSDLGQEFRTIATDLFCVPIRVQ